MVDILSTEIEPRPIQQVILTDLDGALLDHNTYKHSEAAPALLRLSQENIPVIPVTSKSWAEVEKIRKEIPVLQRSPAIVENGGGIVIPKSFISLLPENIQSRIRIADDGENWILHLARTGEEARGVLKQVTEELAVPVLSSRDLSPEEFSELTGLSLEDAILASKKQYTEEFRLANPPTDPLALKEMREKMSTVLKEKGFNLSIGGRFWSIRAGSDKGIAVDMLKELLTTKYGNIHTVGLGDASGDVPMLARCDEGYLVANPHKSEDVDVSMYSNISRTSEVGPAGWNLAVNTFLDNRSQAKE